MTATLQAGQIATPVAWQIDGAHTNVEFAVKHLMIATVKGRFADVAGRVTGDFTRPEKLGLDVTIQTASIDTRQGQRDAHLRSPDFFDVERWPTIRFISKRVEGDVDAEFKLIGDLTIREVTREIVLDVTNEGRVKDPWGNQRVGFSARGRINRGDFGLVWNQVLEMGGVAVGDEIRVSVDVEMTAVPAELNSAA